jgi:O-antigen ligase
MKELIFEVRSWWNALGSRCERTTMLLLILICLTNIFSTAVVQTLVVVSTASLLSCFTMNRSFTVRRTPLDLPYLVFVLTRLLSVLYSQYPKNSLTAIHIEFFFYIVFFLVTQSVRRNEISTTRLVAAIIVGAGVVAALIGVAKVSFHLALRGSSTSAGPYTLGTYLCFALPLALFMKASKEDYHHWRWFIILILCLGIVSTLDRLHMIAMTATILLAGLLSRKRVFAVAFVSALAICLFALSVRFRFDQIVDFHALMNGRDVLWKGAAMLITRHPFVGFGPRTFNEIFPLFQEMPVKGVGSWHNDFLQIYMESGLMGLIALLWLISAICLWGWRIVNSPTLPRQEQCMFVSILTSFGVLFVIGGLIDTLVGIVFRVLLGLFALLLRPAWHQRMGEFETDVPSR